jgi:SPW repeat
MSIETSTRPVVGPSSAIIALLGLWLVVCPWVLGAPGPRVANSGIICGVLILVCSAIRFAYRHTAALSWINALLGAWVIGAAWIFGENGWDIHTWNYTIVGVVIAGLETLSLTSSAMRPQMSPTAVSTRRSARH